MSSTDDSLLSVNGLSVEFDLKDKSTSRVINDLSFDLKAGETLGIVGESGCGKSMTALAIMRLVPTPPGRIASGVISLGGEQLLSATDERIRAVRGNDISMIFQEPMTSLNPVYTIGDQIAETVRLHQGLSRRDARDKAIEMLKAVSMPAPDKRIDEYPHQLSGGMRQRVMIAMALACEPKVLIADEPTTALDVTVQAQIFDLLQNLQEDTGTAIIMITHDMGAIAEMTQRVVVMYAGRKAEEGPVEQVIERPRHPYTKGLISCVPHLMVSLTAERPELTEVRGIVPSLKDFGRDQCLFATRCDWADEKCFSARPPELSFAHEQRSACWQAESI